MKIEKQSVITFTTHLLVICMIFFLPDLLMSYTRPHKTFAYEWQLYAKAATFVAIFYIEYYLILRKSIVVGRQRLWLFVLSNVLMLTVVMIFFYWLQQQWIGEFMAKHRHQPSPSTMMIREWSYLLRDLGLAVLTIALSAALRLGRTWSEISKRHERLIASQRAEELQSLKSQLNPHFLFNTLNTIYSLIDIDSKMAQDAVHRLSHMLRYTLYENPATVPVESEIVFVKDYISLMEMRLGPDAIDLSIDIAPGCNPQVAPLLFITLIENAFKHGNIGDHTKPIKISIQVDKDKIICHTFNHFVSGTAKNSGHAGGIGISNLRRRLSLIYGENASLKISINDDTFASTLTIKTH